MDKENIKMSFLIKELEEYEENITMTDEERTALHDWVRAGNSVYENGDMAAYENGELMEFLDAYRMEKDLQDMLESMSDKEREKYLRELRHEETVDDLREIIDQYWFKISIYEYVLRRHGLMEEAETEMHEAKRRSAEFVKMCIESDDGSEKPFDDWRC